MLADTAGCPATTLATVFYRDYTGQTLPPPGTTLVLDEAGMAATDDLDTLVALADRHGWRLECVGDPEQLPAVGRGGMFAAGSSPSRLLQRRSRRPLTCGFRSRVGEI